MQGSTVTVVAVPFPSRSFISKIVIEQYDGEPANFTIDMFNHNVVEEGGGLSESVGAPGYVGPVPERLYKLGPTLSSDSPGVLEYFSDSATGGHGLGFFSQEDPPAGRQGFNVRKIYVRLTVQGNGEKKFAMCIGGEAQIAGV